MSKKRFIAGATCPECKESDTLRWWKEHHVEVIECVKCGHVDRRSPLSEEKDEHRPEEQDAQVIGIFKPQ
ncbi:metal-binding protein [Enterovibrio norvegicus]|uniref:YheV family putative zinc ribbon protein n=1 Tax=Enterovibrio norvegicus TaxID=188144 RepID=A0ABV4L134_9GAMM|nr:YheV family putative zinc ribbon protein [Enterovibrio norvegicus]MCC4800212.1 YheV family putative metal-binding protein [Enterovibrio norvegicus]OEE45744.1 metal-binding protein [Enterovibrio norvegicus]OEF53393.1 metal-binding protein [Enterovibrio norvegicus]OEF65323.1 metal-binding protein [Enterovibrio norvegicus]PMH71711.1 metal-binding protein [Enterovibrio norvegicus]